MPGAEIQDAEVKFRYFSLGVLYQSKMGYAVWFDITSVPEYGDSVAPIRAACEAIAARRMPTSAGETDPVKRLASGLRIEFLKQDEYLSTRLVLENKVGTRDTVVDGIQIESAWINPGLQIVKDGLNAAAEWLKREFVLSIMAGEDPIAAFDRARDRANMLQLCQ